MPMLDFFCAWNKIAEVLSLGDSGFCLEEKPSFLHEFALLSASEFVTFVVVWQVKLLLYTYN